MKTTTCRQWWKSWFMYHKPQLDFPPFMWFLNHLFKYKFFQMRKISCYRAQVMFGHVDICMNCSKLLQGVRSNSPGWYFFKQLISSSKHQTQNCAMDTATCNMMNIQLLLHPAHQLNQKSISGFSKVYICLELCGK